MTQQYSHDEIRHEVESLKKTDSISETYISEMLSQLLADVSAAGNLLAVIHRDGGHHKEEHGLSSYSAAEAVVLGLRADTEGQIPADDLLYTIELVMDYCKDTMSGSYKPEPTENPLQKIYDVLNIGKTGSIKRPKEEPDGG